MFIIMEILNLWIG